jgi:hypothetical protein
MVSTSILVFSKGTPLLNREGQDSTRYFSLGQFICISCHGLFISTVGFRTGTAY